MDLRGKIIKVPTEKIMREVLALAFSQGFDLWDHHWIGRDMCLSFAEPLTPNRIEYDHLAYYGSEAISFKPTKILWI